MFGTQFEMTDGCCRPPNRHMSIFSAMLSASSSSTPRYLTVLSTLVCPSRSWTARRFPNEERHGYRKITELLHVEGWRVNHKKVERLWREEGLQLPQRHKKRKRLYHKDSQIIRLRPTHPNHVWAIDFVQDKLSNGRGYKMLTVLDEYTRQALAEEVRTRMT